MLSSPLPLTMALVTMTTGVDTPLQQPSLEQDASTFPEYGDLTEERSSATIPDALVPALEAPQENEEVEDERTSLEIRRTGHNIAVQAAPPE